MSTVTPIRPHLKLVAEEPDPMEVWPGVADVNRAGVALAVEMLEHLEKFVVDEHGRRPADYASLEDWQRRGRPFRNIVAEYLQSARKEGSEVEAGFCAVLTDIVCQLSEGMGPTSTRYSSAQFKS
jgi:hypothetical protein